MSPSVQGRRQLELRVLPSAGALIPIILLARQPPNLSSSTWGVWEHPGWPSVTQGSSQNGPQWLKPRGRHLT